MWAVFKNIFGVPDRETDFPKNGEPWPNASPNEESTILNIRIFDKPLPETFGFSIVNDPLQMHSYLEKQMEDLFKHAFNFNNIFQGIAESPSLKEGSLSLRDEILKPGCNQQSHEDSDLDGVINSSEIEKYFDACKPGPPRFSTRSVTIRSIRQPDGTVTTERVERSNDGVEERIVYKNSDHPEADRQVDLSDIERITKLFF